jgi:hypothetical protein
VTAAVRLLHRRHAWGRMAFSGLLAFILAAGAASSARQQGTPPPTWFEDIVLALGVLAAVGIVAALADTIVLRRRPADVRARAVSIAAQQSHRTNVHHLPTAHRVIWALRWVGMLLILVVAVVAVPAPVNGVAYLAGAGHTATFDPVSHDTTCDQYSCQTSTDGILTSGGTSVDATWPDVVPLGRQFQVRDPVWRWGLGEALINSDGIAIGAVVIGLLTDGLGILVLMLLVRLARNWARHRRQISSAAPLPVP